MLEEPSLDKENVERFDVIIQPKKMDILFYDASFSNMVWNIAKMCCNIAKIILLGYALPFGLAMHFLQDRKALGFVILGLCGAFLQLLFNDLYRRKILNSKILLEIADTLGHLTTQPIEGPILRLQDCTSKTMFNQQSQTLATSQQLTEEIKKSQRITLEKTINDIIQKKYPCLTLLGKIIELIGMAAFIYGVIVLAEDNVNSKMSIPLIIYLVFEGLSKLNLMCYLIAFALIVGVSPLICIVVAIVMCCRDDEKQKELKVDLPQSVKSTQQMINDAGGDCTICYQSFVINKDVIQLRCSPNHMFHPLCINSWTKVKSNCPICRAKINLIQENSARERLDG